MEDLYNVLSLLFGITGTVIGTIVGSYLSRNSMILQINIDRKSEIYSATLNLLEELKRKRDLIYDENFINSLFEVKSKIKLFASKSVCSKFEEMWTYLLGIYGAYKEADANFYSLYNLDVDNYVHTESDYNNYKDRIDDYKTEHPIDGNKLNNLIKSIVEEMQEDLKVK